MIKTRFAPSPTGELHIGGARTALFSYLFAKHEGGEFLLRIEDTDRERFVEGATERIIESMKWLGIVPDNIDKPMIQSERKEIYQKYAFELVEKGTAYVCTCTKERLEELRKEQEEKGLPTGYDGRCREHTSPPIRSGAGSSSSPNLGEEIRKELGGGSDAVVRLKMPESEKIIVDDLVRGRVEFEAALQNDPIILKSDGYPTYHLAVVVDDHEMGITHVVRAEEWLPSTPKHLVLYEALGWDKPVYAHLPMILGSDKKKLSKRHGATAVIDYKKEGYLPEAIINFIALLGWNPKDEREEFTLEELVKEFKIENVQKSPAVFNVEKLGDINEKYIRITNYEPACRTGRLRITEIIKQSYDVELSKGETQLAGRGGFKTLKEIAEYIKELRKEPEYEAELLVFRKSDREKTLVALRAVELRITNYELWDTESLQELSASVVSENNLTNGDVFWPVRVALSGAEKSPSPVELMIALGKEESLGRIEKGIKKLVG